MRKKLEMTTSNEYAEEKMKPVSPKNAGNVVLK